MAVTTENPRTAHLKQFWPKAVYRLMNICKGGFLIYIEREKYKLLKNLANDTGYISQNQNVYLMQIN